MHIRRFYLAFQSIVELLGVNLSQVPCDLLTSTAAGINKVNFAATKLSTKQVIFFLFFRRISKTLSSVFRILNFVSGSDLSPILAPALVVCGVMAKEKLLFYSL